MTKDSDGQWYDVGAKNKIPNKGQVEAKPKAKDPRAGVKVGNFPPPRGREIFPCA